MVCIISFVFLYFDFVFLYFYLYFHFGKKGELIPPAKREHVVCIIDGKHLSALQANVLPLNYYKWPKKRDIHQFDSAINQSLNNFICCISQWMFEPSLQCQSSNSNPNQKTHHWKWFECIFFRFSFFKNSFQHLVRITSCLSTGEKLPPNLHTFFNRLKHIGNFYNFEIWYSKLKIFILIQTCGIQNKTEYISNFVQEKGWGVIPN